MYMWVEDCLLQMSLADIFVSRSHGEYHNSPSRTYIYLTGDYGESSDDYFLYSDQLYDFDTETVITDLSGMEIALFVGCYTGRKGETGRNLPVAAVCAGASHAVGFEKSIECEAANYFTKWFFDYYGAGFSVVECFENSIEETMLQYRDSRIDSAILVSCG